MLPSGLSYALQMHPEKWLPSLPLGDSLLLFPSIIYFVSFSLFFLLFFVRELGVPAGKA